MSNKDKANKATPATDATATPATPAPDTYASDLAARREAHTYPAQDADTAMAYLRDLTAHPTKAGVFRPVVPADVAVVAGLVGREKRVRDVLRATPVSDAPGAPAIGPNAPVGPDGRKAWVFKVDDPFLARFVSRLVGTKGARATGAVVRDDNGWYTLDA